MRNSEVACATVSNAESVYAMNRTSDSVPGSSFAIASRIIRAPSEMSNPATCGATERSGDAGSHPQARPRSVDERIGGLIRDVCLNDSKLHVRIFRHIRSNDCGERVSLRSSKTAVQKLCYRMSYTVRDTAYYIRRALSNRQWMRWTVIG